MKKSSIVVVALIALACGMLLSWYIESNKSIKLEAGSEQNLQLIVKK